MSPTRSAAQDTGKRSLSELRATLTATLRRSSARANEQAARLRVIGEQVSDIVGEMVVDAHSDELSHCAVAIRGAVGQALIVLAELQGEAGLFEGLAALRLTDEAANGTGARRAR
jgi:hypothetical protein